MASLIYFNLTVFLNMGTPISRQTTSCISIKRQRKGFKKVADQRQNI
ncbi:MAG: hypothetical protein ACOX6L_04530 [Syntrophomonadaceae bacterium]